MREERKRLSTAKEIAELLNTSRRMVHYFRKRHGMPACRFGPRTYRFDRDDVLRWSENFNTKGSRPDLRAV
jgi:excisionase family DNA binding protein